MTNCTGGPPVEPGSEGSANEIAWAPAMPATFGCRLCRICFCVRLRSSHGLNRMPAMAWCTLLPMPLMMKTCSFSGTVSNTL